MKSALKILPYAIIVILLLFLFKSCDKESESTALIDSLNDTLHTERNEKGQQIARIQVIETANKKQFLEIKSKDSSIIKLQDLVKKTKNLTSAIILSNTTGNTISGQTTVTAKDTVKKDSLIYIYPEYSFHRSAQWDSVDLKMNRNNTNLTYRVWNSYEITTAMKRKGLFKKYPEITILNLNPLTETKELKAFQINCECHPMRSFLIGAGTGLIGGYLLKR